MKISLPLANNDHTTTHVDTVIMGGGQAGLAMSRCLFDRSIDHVVLERGSVGERWRSSYWDSLRLLTPNWYSRLPGGWHYRGPDQDQFMTAKEFVNYLEHYAASFQAPIKTNNEVILLESIVSDETENTHNGNDGNQQTKFKLTTQTGEIFCAKNVVLATGYCDSPKVPPCSEKIPSFVRQITAVDYKNPSQILQHNDHNMLKTGGDILIVGSGASGLQIAKELVKATKDDPNVRVTISSGRHTRCPRSYRGKDILWWLDRTGALACPANQVEEKQSPGPQLTGDSDYADINLYVLNQKFGVQVVGKLTNVTEDNVLTFDNDSLKKHLEEADLKCVQMMQLMDDCVTKHGLNAQNTSNLLDIPASHETLCPQLQMDASSSSPDKMQITSNRPFCIIWATGFTRHYPFLSDSLRRKFWDPTRKILKNDGGVVTAEEGLYVLGYRWSRRKNSNFVDGVGLDAKELVDHMLGVRTGWREMNG